MTNQNQPVVNSEPEFDLDFHIHMLLREEPFFARVSRYIDKRSDKTIPTCGIRLNKDSLNFELIYNPLFMNSLTEEQKRGVLMHEFYHVALAHCTSRFKKDIEMRIQNVAMDLAINGLPNMINRLPEIACIPGKGNFEKFPAGNTFEWYLAALQEECKNNSSSSINNSDSFDEHGEWTKEEIDKLKDIIAKKAKEIVEKAANECDKASCWGSVSAETKKQIKETLFNAKLNPKSIFSYFCKTSVKSNRKNSIMKINRRWPYIHSGKTVERRANIAIAVDQSGSVSDEMLEKIFNWMQELSKFCSFTVVPFDDKVFESKIYKWEKNAKRTKERVLCGGTNFDAPTDYVNKNGSFDALIIYTDLCARVPKRCNVPRLWLTDTNCKNSCKFNTHEKILAID